MNAPVQNQAQSPAKAFQTYMLKYKSQLELALPKHLTADRMIRLALTAFSSNPALQQCDSNSIFSSIIIASQLGLEPGVNGQGYLVPYKGKCTFIPGWKGLVDLAQRGGRSSVWTGAVYEGDDFDYMLGDAPYCKHRPCGEFDVNKLTHVYAIGRVKDSEMPIIEVWPVKKVRAHFTKTVVKALQPNHYSHKHFEAYARKVALLQVLKYMPQSIELSNAMDVSQAQESGKNVTIDGDFVTVESDQQYAAQEQYNQGEDNQVQQQAPEQAPIVTEQNNDADYAPTFAQIKRGILTAKSPAHLDVMEEQAMDHADKEERKQLMQLVKAQAQKFEEVTPVKKPEQPIEDESPTEAKKPRSRRAAVEEVQPANDEVIEQIETVNAAEKPQLPTNPNIYQMLDAAKSLEDLEPIIEHINVAQKHQLLSMEDIQDIKVSYAKRKEQFSQQEIFEEPEFTGLSPQSMNGLFSLIESQQRYQDLTMTYKSKISNLFDVMTEDQRNEIMVCYEAKMETFK